MGKPMKLSMVTCSQSFMNALIPASSAGKFSTSTSRMPVQLAGKVISNSSFTTMRYNSCSCTNSTLSITPRSPKILRMINGLSSVPNPLNWCNATSNSNSPRTKDVAQPPGILWRSSNKVLAPPRCRAVAAVRPALPAPMTMASKSVEVFVSLIYHSTIH